MAIRMQGSWTVSVKSKNAAFSQRFIIQGASSGNGTFVGDVSTPPVFVTGPDWTIRVQNNPGSGWVESEDQITFPTTSAGQQRFDIQTNDSGGDSDFDDLVLTCSMPVSATDFLIYGHASSYEGVCILNPCFPRFVVIDSAIALAEAIKFPKLREVLRKLYPERLKPQPPNPPDPPPFKPMIISLDGATPIPPKQNLDISLRRLNAVADTKVKGAVAPRLATISSIRKSDAVQSASSALLDSVALASLADRFRFNCNVESLAGVVLRFQEYDRTGSELAGGVYTGAGLRENLGVTVTDRNGNYIFRFSRTIQEFFDEGALDTGTGEVTVTQSAPDVIVQLIDVMAPGTVLWESAPYFNILPLRRINICIPKDRLHPSRCVAGQIIQAVGNIFVGPAPAGPRPLGEPPGFGQRVGFNNAIGLRGRVTARNTSGPQTRCAAWRGTLDLFGCFLDHPSVTHYTIRYREFGVNAGWTLFSQELRHPLISKAGQPGYNGELIGPHTVNLHVDGGAAVLVPSYLNIENDVLFVSTHRDRRAQIRSWLLSVPMPGPVQVRIEGYDGSGNRVAGADDSVTLFIDNVGAFVDIDDIVTMGSATLGNCAKFKLPAGSPGAPLTVKFKADHAEGFLSTYELFMQKGAIGSFSVQPPPPAAAPFRLQSYNHGDDLACNELRGTFDDPTHDPVTGYVTVDLTPASGHWLESTETFCAFSLNLNATTRVTDGYGGGDSYNAIPVLIGIEA